MTDDAAREPRYPLALEAICSQRWLILPEALDTIISIARTGAGENYRPEAKPTGSPLIDALSVEDRPAPVNRNGTAVISITGPIFPMANLLTNNSGATSLRAVQREFAAALEDRAVERIVLAIDSPGGVADGIQAFAEQIYQARARKPIIAVAQDLAASAALWIASAASEFVVSPASFNGSIGVVLTASKGREREGEVQVVSTQSPNKRQDPTSESGRASLQKMVDGLAGIFVGDVARNRGVPVETVLETFGKGGVMIGAEAVAVGMADRVGTLEQVIAGFAGNQREGKEMTTAAAADTPAITRELIAEKHPAIAEAFRAEGAERERARIKAVQEQSIPGHEALVETLKFDGKTTAGEAAIAVLKADKSARGDALDRRRANAPAPVKPAIAPTTTEPRADDSMPVEDRCRAEWQANADDVRNEFASVEDYIAYSKANSAGRVKVLKNKSA